jgi:predicted transcriptional regulator
MSITVRLPDDLATRLAEEAERQSVTPDELAARVLAEHIPNRRQLGFVAIGESASGRTAAEAEEMLAEGFGL